MTASATPFNVGISTTSADTTLQLIEQVLFTQPGERVNRPDFGSGVLQLVFAPNSPELAATAEFLVRGALQQWLGDLILVEDVSVTSDDARLSVAITFIERRSGDRTTAEFTREAAP
ncbi:hypothetical protein Sa4125_22900 [Aureimonas sp. SA4125]|uniref:GPW/gp25 family protein n=1 Tax=Aureimonas sp. SA4125 TaxID=2826993 RepID=UPI001CC6539A|nr:GPW/gp25 family protein [Aureimonas sp. SA4125]BDA84748.1 hypothetical protein Sa4125_22900 [Aureimonas sp. SA4125]